MRKTALKVLPLLQISLNSLNTDGTLQDRAAQTSATTSLPQTRAAQGLSSSVDGLP